MPSTVICSGDSGQTSTPESTPTADPDLLLEELERELRFLTERMSAKPVHMEPLIIPNSVPKPIPVPVEVVCWN